MVQIAPSILAADFAHLAEDCQKVVPHATNVLHIDVMDGCFVPNISIGAGVLHSLSKALPKVEYDVHLMIMHPEKFVGAFAKAGASNITFHVEAGTDIGQTLADIRAAGCKSGLSLRPCTPVEELFPWLSQLDIVLVMSVEPGFGGQAFMENAPQRIAALKAEIDRQNLAVNIHVDGGIVLHTAALCAKAGANLLVAGSFVFDAPQPAQAVDSLLAQCR